MDTVTFDPEIPLALWLPLALVAVGLLVAYAVNSRGRVERRRWLGILILMAIAIAMPLVLLLNPTWVKPIPPPAGKSELAILIDSTGSMAVGDSTEGQSRYATALQVAEKVIEELGDQYETRVWSLGDTTNLSDLATLAARTPDAKLSDLAGGVEQALMDRPQGQALLLLSDGVHNASGGVTALRQSAAKALAMSIPVYTLPIGKQSGVEDIDVALRLPQEMIFQGQSVPVVVSIQQRGNLANRSRLSLLLDDQEIDSQDVQLTADGTTEATFEITQKASGLYRYEVQIDSISGEVTDLNNRATLLLRVVDEPVRVLLLEGKPYWDTKFLTRTLASDSSVHLTSIVRLAENRFMERQVATAGRPEDSAAPSASDDPTQRSDKWAIHSDLATLFSGDRSLASYQVIVLGRDAEVFLNDERVAELKKWLVDDGGALVCFRGSPATQVSQQMAELMPVHWTPARESRFRVQLTESGRAIQWLPRGSDSQELLTQLPSLATVTRAERPKPLAVVLATTTETDQEPVPVISYQPMGTGRVLVVEGAGMWRWAFLPPSHQQLDNAYGLLWRSLVRWLVANSGLLPSQQVALRSDKVTFSTLEAATATLLLREAVAAAPKVELTGNALAEPQLLEPMAVGSWPGQFRVTFGKLPEGRYRARVVESNDEAAAVAAFDVRDNLSERLNVAARPDLLRLLATDSGGSVLESAEPQELGQKIRDDLAASRPQRSSRESAWDRWWILMGVYFLWATAWGVRRWSGLV